jgi:hypothetical protein
MPVQSQTSQAWAVMLQKSLSRSTAQKPYVEHMPSEGGIGLPLELHYP